MCEPRAVGARVIDGDPVAAAWRDDLRRRSLGHADRVLFVRRLLTRDGGEAPGPAQGALWVDAKRVYMELRPGLRRVYTTIRDLPTYGPQLEPLGFRPLPGAPLELDGAVHHSLGLDFGPGSVDGWLTGLVAGELGVESDPRLDAAGRRLRLDGRDVALTELELALLTHLHDRGGAAVPRAELLRAVWGHEWQGAGTNVIEVAVSGIRRKLGEHAGLLQTVRDVGYRWRDGSG